MQCNFGYKKLTNDQLILNIPNNIKSPDKNICNSQNNKITNKITTPTNIINLLNNRRLKKQIKNNKKEKLVVTTNPPPSSKISLEGYQLFSHNTENNFPTTTTATTATNIAMGRTKRMNDIIDINRIKNTSKVMEETILQNLTNKILNNKNILTSVSTLSTTTPIHTIRKSSATIENLSSISSSTSSSSLSSSLSSSSTSTTSTQSTSLSASSFSAFKNMPPMKVYKRIAVSFLVILEVLLVPVIAGPVNVRHHRIVRDIYTDLENNRPIAPLQNETEHDDTCLLDGIITKRATIHCETKPGCKAIQKTGYCCPEYQCECEKDGKIYSNHETVPDQYQTPCKVCFCKGGEVVCADVTCYKRDDCEPKYISGRCCPEYDNCPPLEIGKSTTPKTLIGIIHNIASDSPDNSLQKFDQTSAASTIHHQQSHEMPLNNPLNITIKEITKVEEIRITDAPPVNGVPKPKPSILQVYTTSNPLGAAAANNKNEISSTTLTQIATAKDSQQQSLNSIEGKTLDDEIISPSSSASSSSIGGELQLNNENTKLTLVETKTILFPATDISPYHNDKISTTSNIPYSPILYSTTESNKVVISDNNLLNGEESIKIVRHASVPTNNNNNNRNVKGENNFIQVSNHNGNIIKDKNNFELSNEQAGEEVVIIDKNGESKPIKVFGIKGLQRGDVIEDPNLSSNRFDNSLEKRKDQNNKGSSSSSSSSKEYNSNENDDIDPIQASSSDDFVRFVIGSTTEGINKISDSSEDSNLNSSKAGEDEIYEPVLYTEGPDSSSVSPGEEIFEPIHYTPEPEAGETELNNTSEETKIYDTVFHTSEEETIFEPVYHDLENDTISTSGPENVSSEPFPFEAEDEGDVNPAYPKIEEDLSIHHLFHNGAADYLEGDTETKSLVHATGGVQIQKEEPRSVIDSLHIENPKILSNELKFDITTESHQIINQFNDLNSSLENDTIFNDIIEPNENPEARVPGEPCLIPEWERINGTGESRCNQTIINSSSSSSSNEDYSLIGLQLLKDNDSWPINTEIDIEYGSGSGMGSGMGGYSFSNLIDNREPTTPNPNKIIDIDEIDNNSSGGSGNGSTSLGNDPKNDAESLKLDENDNISSSGSGVGISGTGIASEINKKSAKSFYGFDSFMFF